MVVGLWTLLGIACAGMIGFVFGAMVAMASAFLVLMSPMSSLAPFVGIFVFFLVQGATVASLLRARHEIRIRRATAAPFPRAVLKREARLPRLLRR
jgi:hypothetical protein